MLDPEELLGIVPTDLKIPFDPREVIARLVDGSEFDEFKPLYGRSLVTGYAQLHGYPIGILANAQGVLFSEEAQKAAQFIQLANQTDTPLLFLHNTTGYMVGAEYEQGGIIKHGAQMINAVSNSTVPHLSVVMGASYGAGHYGMSGRAYDPRFMFSWPNAKSAVMGPAQLAGVISIVARGAAESKGQPYDEEGDSRACADLIEEQIEKESLAYFTSGMLYDDGVIDPRDTRTILGICLSRHQHRARRGRRRLRGVPPVRRNDEAFGPAAVPECIIVRPTGGPNASSSVPVRRPPLITIRRVLVANRGEIARRVFRTCRDLGISTVAVFSDADAGAPFVAEADVAVRLPGSAPSDTYLRGDLVIDAARRRPAPTRSTPATASCPRTPTSPARSRRPG